MNKQALFCDGTARYVCPLEPEVGETVTLKFRAAKEDNIQIRLAINNELYTMESEKIIIWNPPIREPASIVIPDFLTILNLKIIGSHPIFQFPFCPVISERTIGAFTFHRI